MERPTEPVKTCANWLKKGTAQAVEVAALGPESRMINYGNVVVSVLVSVALPVLQHKLQLTICPESKLGPM